MKGCDKYKDLWEVRVIIFTISRGQSQIQRGFSINKEVTIENLENKLLGAQRLVYDTLKCCKKDAHYIEITAKMVTSCKTARSGYVITLEETKRSRENEAANNNRKIIAEKIGRVKCKQMEVDICIQLLNKCMNECLDKGEASNDMAMFLKVNAFRKAISEKKGTMGKLDEAIKKLKEHLKKK